MPPDINAGPMVAAGTPPGRASALTIAGPPGSDPLAALFAAFLAQSAGPSPTGAAVTMPKTAPKPGTPAGANGRTTEDKTQDKTLSAALLTLPPLLAPIQMRPTLPPTAGVSAARKIAGKKTMDTSPVSASPMKEKADVKPGGELPLQAARMTTSGASALFPAFLIASPAIASPAIASPTPPSVPSVKDDIMASPGAVASGAAVLSLPVVTSSLPSAVSVASPGVFVLSAAAASALPTEGTLPQSSPATPAVAFAAAPSQTALADDAPPPQGAVPSDAVLLPTTLPAGDKSVGETTAADAPGATAPVLAPVSLKQTGQALPDVVQGLVTTLPQAIKAQPGLISGTSLGVLRTAKAAASMPLLAASAGVTATERLSVMDGKDAKEGVSAMDGKAATDGRTATEGEVTTDGKAAKGGGSATDGPVAMDGRVAMEGKTLTGAGAPEKVLKSAALSADTLTGSQTVPAKKLSADLGLPVVGKRAERGAESADNDALPALPTPVPAQAEAARTEAKPLTAADRAEMVRQVAEGVGMTPLPAKPGASDQMTLQLHPKDWGQLQISVKITPGAEPNAAQAVTAHIVTQNPQVKAALESGSSDLRQALREAGLHLDRVSVTVQRMDASAQSGTATSGGRHEANHGGASQGMDGAFGASNQKIGMSKETGMSKEAGMPGASGNGMPSFAASGGSHGGRQGGQPPPAYAAAYAPTDQEDASPSEVPRRLASGQVDIRA